MTPRDWRTTGARLAQNGLQVCASRQLRHKSPYEVGGLWRITTGARLAQTARLAHDWRTTGANNNVSRNGPVALLKPLATPPSGQIGTVSQPILGWV